MSDMEIFRQLELLWSATLNSVRAETALFWRG